MLSVDVDFAPPSSLPPCANSNYLAPLLYPHFYHLGQVDVNQSRLSKGEKVIYSFFFHHSKLMLRFEDDCALPSICAIGTIVINDYVKPHIG